MKNQTEIIVKAAIQYLYKQFKYRLRIEQLISLVPSFNVTNLQLITYQIAYTDKISQPKTVQYIQQDCMPNNIPLDINANFRIDHKAIQQQQQITITQPQLQATQLTHTTESPMTTHQPVASSPTQLFALSQPLVQSNQAQLDLQITQIQKNLYFKRRLIKYSQDQCNQRLTQILNRKHLHLPKSDFAYDFTGELIPKKKPSFANPSVIQLRQNSKQTSQSINIKRSLLDKSLQERDFLISRGENASRQAKRLLFGNSGKRQLSHLPIIKLNNNTKISQTNRSLLGPDTSNQTLKSYQSRGEGSFKHHSELQRQRSQRLYSLKHSSKVTQFTDQDDVEQKSQIQPLQVKKQSKRMQKYLKKLCEDRSKQLFVELNRSSNFDRLNSPHDYSVHRYYKYNFDQQKSRICESSLMNLKLNMSRFKQ